MNGQPMLVMQNNCSQRILNYFLYNMLHKVQNHNHNIHKNDSYEIRNFFLHYIQNDYNHNQNKMLNILNSMHNVEMVSSLPHSYKYRWWSKWKSIWKEFSSFSIEQKKQILLSFWIVSENYFLYNHYQNRIEQLMVILSISSIFSGLWFLYILARETKKKKSIDFNFMIWAVVFESKKKKFFSIGKHPIFTYGRECYLHRRHRWKKIFLIFFLKKYNAPLGRPYTYIDLNVIIIKSISHFYDDLNLFDHKIIQKFRLPMDPVGIYI